MGLTLLYYIEQQYFSPTSKHPINFDLMVICQFDYMMDLSKWNAIVEAQWSPHDLLIGDVRDKAQKPREFANGNGAYFNEYQDYMHLYLGSEALALSTTLIPKILQEARSNREARTIYWENNLGHDLTCLAYMSPKTVLHWVPLTRQQQFWSTWKT